MSHKQIKVGDWVTYHGGPCLDTPKLAKVELIGVIGHISGHSPAGFVDATNPDLDINHYVFDLADGNWCYGGQIVQED